MKEFLGNNRYQKDYNNRYNYNYIERENIEIEPKKKPYEMQENNDNSCNYLTQENGKLVSDDQNILTIGPEGKGLMEDVVYFEKLSHFDRERIPERVVHANGAGAFGYFQTFQSMERYTKAKFLSKPNKKTKAFVRFSPVTGSKGFPDTDRDPRGFAVKLYTEDGNHDIVGLHFPVFFLRDPAKFPDLIHSLKNSPVNDVRYRERFWDFISTSPETTHMITWLYSDRGTIKDYANIDGFSINTYVWVNKEGKRHYVRYHFKTRHGIKTLTRKEAKYLAGVKPDIARQRLYDRIASKRDILYDFCVQLMDPKKAEFLEFDPLDPTQEWPEERFPLIKVGLLCLNKNPDNYFAQVEQSAFCPANTVDGVEFSNDKVLQGRVFSYFDTQRYRIGTNFMQLPINRPIVSVDNNLQDGRMAYFNNTRDTNYLPNRLNNNLPKEAPKNCYKGQYQNAGYVTREPIRKADDFTQAGKRYASMTRQERESLCDNIAVELYKCRRDIIQCCVNNFSKAHKDFGYKVMERVRYYQRIK